MYVSLDEIRGVFPAMVTPVDRTGAVDETAVNALVEYFIAAGVNGLYVLGTTGESPLLTRAQKEAMVAAVLKAVDGRIPVMVHVGTLPVSECLSFAQRVQELGVRFLSAIPPYYFAFGEEDLLCYYRALLDVVRPDCRLFAYNIPAFARNAIPPAVLQTLAHDERFAGVKDSAGDFALTQQYLSVLPQDRKVFIGSDDLINRALTAGVQGSISGNANVLPELFVALYQARQSGDDAKTEMLQGMVDRLAQATCYGNLPLLKLGMKWRGVDAGEALMPFDHHIEEEKAQRLRCTLAELQEQLQTF